jgi:hypothetical protein
MTRPFQRPRFARSFADFALGLVLFSALMGSLSVPPSGAFPAPPPAELITSSDTKFADRLPGDTAAHVIAFKTAAAQPDQTSTRQPLHLGLLAFVLASLTAFNLMIIRHLRAAYAVERRQKTTQNS